MKRIYSLLALLTLALSACGTTPTPELGQGVDKYGPYTVVARSGDELTSQAQATNGSASRTIELRRYGTARYGSVLTLRESNGSLRYRGNVSISNYFKNGSGPYNRAYQDFDRYSSSPTTMTLSLSPRTMRNPKVCATADGLFINYNRYPERYEHTRSKIMACDRTDGT